MNSFLAATTVLALAAAFGAAQPIDYLVDQQHDWPFEVESYYSIQSLNPVQEITPAIGALDVVEIWTEDIAFPVSNGVGATLELLIRENSTNGTLVATSAPLVLPDGWNGVSRFEFTKVVWVTPEARYALELRVVEGAIWGAHSHGSLFPPVYPRGRFFVGGKPTDAVDLWFRTGLRVPAPRLVFEGDGLRWQGVPPLTYRVWGSVNLKDWGEVGQVSASDTNCVFTNIVRGEPRLFYRLSQP